jgi:hypothetical protein
VGGVEAGKQGVEAVFEPSVLVDATAEGVVMVVRAGICSGGSAE